MGRGVEQGRSELQRIAGHRRGSHRLRVRRPGLMPLRPCVQGERSRERAPRWGPAVTRWGMVIDTARCVGCGACTVACKTENATPGDIWYAPVIEYEVGD